MTRPPGGNYRNPIRGRARAKVGNPTGAAHDIARIAYAAQDVVEWIHDEDPQQLYNQLIAHAWVRPAFIAQIVMALAAWVDPDERLDVRTRRVESITARRTAA